MLTRSFLGLLKGGLLGIAVAAVLVFGLGIAIWPAWLAYAAMAATGAVSGLTLGKPVWCRDAKIEASLKAVVGAVVGVVATYGAHKWLAGQRIDLSALGAGAGAIGDLPAVLIPLLTAGLGLVYEADNSEGGSTSEARRADERRVRVDGTSGEPMEREEPEREESRARRMR